MIFLNPIFKKNNRCNSFIFPNGLPKHLFKCKTFPETARPLGHFSTRNCVKCKLGETYIFVIFLIFRIPSVGVSIFWRKKNSRRNLFIFPNELGHMLCFRQADDVVFMVSAVDRNPPIDFIIHLAKKHDCLSAFFIYDFHTVTTYYFFYTIRHTYSLYYLTFLFSN